MNAGINLSWTLGRPTIGESSEEQLVYMLIEATPQGLGTTLPKLPLNLSVVVDRSSSMRGERLRQVKDALQRIVDQLSPDDYFSLVIFNDRADVIVPAQRVINRSDIKMAIGQVEAAGGTEMATGLALAHQEIRRPLMSRGVSRVLLLTDGRTYGDESRCVEIARRMQGAGIGLTAMGVGNEWNEDLLETMAARENSRTQYITSANEITTVFAEELKRMHAIFAQSVRLKTELRPGATLRSLDRVRPFIATLPVEERESQVWEAMLGDWPNTEPQAFLLEVVVPALPTGDHPLLKLTLSYTLPAAAIQGQASEGLVRLGVKPRDQVSREVEPLVKHWLERVVAYRLQANAWRKVEAGEIEAASRQLQMAGTRLFEAGEVSLAQTVQEEATRLLRSGSASAEGRKRIKYGTRGLVSGADAE
jgi:Ca-activated chloride channel homolog